jgi:hypothetical protein
MGASSFFVLEDFSINGKWIKLMLWKSCNTKNHIPGSASASYASSLIEILTMLASKDSDSINEVVNCARILLDSPEPASKKQNLL